MPEPICEPQDAGFAFTDEDFARRYSSEASSAAGDTPANGIPTTASPGPGRRGGGNSFMRALRRRRAASAATALDKINHPPEPAV